MAGKNAPGDDDDDVENDGAISILADPSAAYRSDWFRVPVYTV